MTTDVPEGQTLERDLGADAGTSPNLPGRYYYAADISEAQARNLDPAAATLASQAPGFADDLMRHAPFLGRLVCRDPDRLGVPDIKANWNLARCPRIDCFQFQAAGAGQVRPALPVI